MLGAILELAHGKGGQKNEIEKQKLKRNSFSQQYRAEKRKEDKKESKKEKERKKEKIRKDKYR